MYSIRKYNSFQENKLFIRSKDNQYCKHNNKVEQLFLQHPKQIPIQYNRIYHQLLVHLDLDLLSLHTKEYLEVEFLPNLSISK